MNNDLQAILKLHTSKYIIFKDSKQYEEALKEIEIIVSLLSKALLLFIKKETSTAITVTNNTQVVANIVTFEDVIDPKKCITIDQFGNLKIKKIDNI